MFKAIYRHIIRPLLTFIKKCIRWPFVMIFKIKKRAIQFIQNHYFRRHTTLIHETEFKARHYQGYTVRRTAQSNQVHWQVQNIERNTVKSEKINIVFVCQYSPAWSACESTFRAALSDPNIHVVIVALPDKLMEKGRKKVGDASGNLYGEDTAYEYCKSFFPETINGYDRESGTWFDLTSLNPDYVILSRCGQVYYPQPYKAKTLATYTKVCLIPYSYCKMKWDSRIVYQHALMDYVYATFTENQLYCDMLRGIYHDILGADWKKIEYFGYPRFDLYGERDERTSNDRKTVIWLPRWATEKFTEASTFFKYKDILIDYFLKHPEYKLICRPHPKMFDNFIVTGEMTEAEVDEFKKLFAETDNLHLDEYSDYLPSFDEADVFVSDTSSLLVEEFITGKPVIFCGISSHFDEDAKKWARYFYPVHSKRGLLDKMTDLLSGNDPGREERKRYIREEMKHDGHTGERIVQFLKNDYFGQVPSSS